MKRPLQVNLFLAVQYLIPRPTRELQRQVGPRNIGTAIHSTFSEFSRVADMREHLCTCTCAFMYSQQEHMCSITSGLTCLTKIRMVITRGFLSAPFPCRPPTDETGTRLGIGQNAYTALLKSNASIKVLARRSMQSKFGGRD